MNTNDIMVDGETLSKWYDAPIIALGAVCFDRTTGKIGPKFYEVIDLQSAINSGRVDGETLTWWMTQNPRAKHIFAEATQKEAKTLATVLLAFSSFARMSGKGVPRLWCKGPAEDATWIKHGMHQGGHGLEFPFHHQNVRDVRTIIELAEEIAGFDVKTIKDVGDSHNALDDCMYQVNCVVAAYKALHTLTLMPSQREKIAKAALKATSKDDDEDEL